MRATLKSQKMNTTIEVAGQRERPTGFRHARSLMAFSGDSVSEPEFFP